RNTRFLRDCSSDVCSSDLGELHPAAGGRVKFSGWQGGHGFLVVIEDGDTEYYYAHASELLVNEGDVVAACDTIALVGSTGNSTRAEERRVGKGRRYGREAL